MGAHSLLLKAEQRETIHDNIGRTSRHLVLLGLLCVVKPEENIYCASRSFWGGDAAMANVIGKPLRAFRRRTAMGSFGSTFD